MLRPTDLMVLLLAAGVGLSGCGSTEPALASTGAAVAIAASGWAALAARLRARADQARALGGPVRIDAGTAGARVIDPTSASLVADGAGGAPVLTLTLSPDALEPFAKGELSPTQAMIDGKLTIEGDFGALMTVTALLDTGAGDGSASVDGAAATTSRDPIAAARMAVFDSWGATYPDGRDQRILPIVSSRMRGGPAWPTRESYAYMHVGTHTIVATDGLSDPSSDDATQTTGFDMEVWVETDAPVPSIAASWVTALVIELGYQVAAGVVTRPNLDRFGMMSLEVPVAADDARWPKAFIGPTGTVGVLIGATSPDRPETLAAPFAHVRYVNVRVLLPGEVAELVAGGLPVAKRLAAAGTVSRVPAE
ncbi:MAG: SCP2 sterol-binding domain-containing protein [Myxococcota bacterium]